MYSVELYVKVRRAVMVDQCSEREPSTSLATLAGLASALAEFGLDLPRQLALLTSAHWIRTRRKQAGEFKAEKWFVSQNSSGHAKVLDD